MRLIVADCVGSFFLDKETKYCWRILETEVSLETGSKKVASAVIS